MRILVIAPHADDEVLGAGGSVSKHIAQGNDVHLLICGERRQDNMEQIKSATEHYKKSYMLKYDDEAYYESFDDMLKSVEQVYNQIKPHVVYIPNRDDFNRDHRCVFEICEIVCRRYQAHAPTRVLMYETPSSTTQSFNNNFKCNHYETLSQQHIMDKIDTLMLYKNELREFPNPRSERGVLVQANFRGMECGFEFAEGFNILYNKS